MKRSWPLILAAVLALSIFVIYGTESINCCQFNPELSLNSGADSTTDVNVSGLLTTKSSRSIMAYLISESPIKPEVTDPKWKLINPPRKNIAITFDYTFSGLLGQKTLYAWVKNASSHISDSVKYSIFQSNHWEVAIRGLHMEKGMALGSDEAQNIYITGWTKSDITTAQLTVVPYSKDLFIAKYNRQGDMQWIDQLTLASGGSLGNAIHIDHPNILVAGVIQGDFIGQTTPTPSLDVLLATYKFNGTKEAPIRLSQGGNQEVGDMVKDQDGNLYLMGSSDAMLDGQERIGTKDTFITKYNASGQLQWTTKIGVINSKVTGKSMVLDKGGNILVFGHANGEVNNGFRAEYNPFLVHINASSGSQKWTKDFPSPSDVFAADMALDSKGNIYLSGSTKGDFAAPNKGGYDFFIIKLAPDGTNPVKKQFGTIEDDRAVSLVVNDKDEAIVIGSSSGNLGDQINTDQSDLFIYHFDNSLNPVWIKLFGGSEVMNMLSAAHLDNLGNLYITGSNAYQYTNSGSYDAFLMKNPGGFLP